MGCGQGCRSGWIRPSSKTGSGSEWRKIPQIKIRIQPNQIIFTSTFFIKITSLYNNQYNCSISTLSYLWLKMLQGIFNLDELTLSGSDLFFWNTDPDPRKTPGSATLVTANCNNTLLQIQTRTLKGDATQKPNWTIWIIWGGRKENSLLNEWLP